VTELDHAAAVDALEAGYRRVTDVVAGLGDAELMLPTGCAGWAVTDVLYHQLLDAQRALVAFATPGPGPARPAGRARPPVHLTPRP
jgi:Mycothiol maleylpyruvate isomerase N-terminal domain